MSDGDIAALLAGVKNPDGTPVDPASKQTLTQRYAPDMSWLPPVVREYLAEAMAKAPLGLRASNAPLQFRNEPTLYRGTVKQDSLSGFFPEIAAQEKYRGGTFVTPDRESAVAYSATAPAHKSYTWWNGNLKPGKDSSVLAFTVDGQIAKGWKDYNPATHVGVEISPRETVIFNRDSLIPNDAPTAAQLPDLVRKK